MRKMLFILVMMVVSMSASYASAQKRCDRHHEDSPGYEHRGRHHRSPYFVCENKVYFDGKKINGASPYSFKVLRDGYAKDIWHVYFDAVRIEGASPDSFRVLRDGYARDTWNTYYYGRKID